LGKQEGLVTEFDDDLWHSLVDYATVYSETDVRFQEMIDDINSGKINCVIVKDLTCF
jgi:hypothetical protein